MGKVFSRPYGRKELVNDALKLWGIYSESYRQVYYYVNAALWGEEDGDLLRGISKDELELPYVELLIFEKKFQALAYLNSISETIIRQEIRSINELPYNFTYNTTRTRIATQKYKQKGYKKFKFGVDPDYKGKRIPSHMRKHKAAP